MRVNWRAMLAVLALGWMLLTSVPAKALEVPCGPSPDPNGSPWWWDMDSSGIVGLYYCKTPTGWISVAGYGHWDELPGDWLQQIPKLLYGTKAMRDAAFNATSPDEAGRNYASLKALLAKMRAEHDKDYRPAPVPKWQVQPISTNKRPYYKANTAGTGIGTKMGDVATLTLCDGAKRLGMTSYFWVPSVSGYALCQLVP